MIDATTKQPLTVLTDGGVGPYLELREPQLDEVEALLKRHDIYYWVEEHMVSLDDEPYIATINFDLDADPVMLQAVLDNAR